MSINVEYRYQTKIPVEVEGITPCRCREMSLTQIQKMPVFHGNESRELGELFSVSGDPSDERWRWQGDLQGVHWLGAGMTSGEFVVESSVGRHVGSGMTGGSIEVQGDCSDWAGGEMKGGRLQIRGNAGHLIGSAYRGSPIGMTGGWILVEGRAGNEVGHTMRRGLIAVGGDLGDLAGFNMLAGTLLVFGRPGIRHGAGMVRGTLGFFGDPPPLLPTFRAGCRFRPPMLTPLFRRLRTYGFAVPEALDTAEVDLYHGDFLEGGRGELLLRAASSTGNR